MALADVLLEEYLGYSPSQSLTVMEERPWQSTPEDKVAASQLRLLFTCFLLEGVGNICQCLGDEFQVKLIDALLPHFKKLGDSNGLISDYAWTSLLRVCQHCNYVDIPALIQANCDYLVDKIAAQM